MEPQNIGVWLYTNGFNPFDTHGLQLVTEDMYKIRVHVLIYGHTWS
jgi:hypothetical protein